MRTMNKLTGYKTLDDERKAVRERFALNHVKMRKHATGFICILQMLTEEIPRTCSKSWQAQRFCNSVNAAMLNDPRTMQTCTICVKWNKKPHCSFFSTVVVTSKN